MKSIFCLILVVLTWGESLETYWQQMRAGRYGEAATSIEKYLSEGRKVTELDRIEGTALIQKARLCQEMSETSKKVEIFDSVKTTKDKMVKACLSIISASKLTRGDKRMMSVDGDIYRQYGDDEKERLSSVVNTNQNEDYPFEMPDGVTLYFASEGHGAIGGYDIFCTKYDSETSDYSEPQNVGMPFNTLGNDYLMMADDIAGIGLWTTDWRQTADSVMVYVYKLGGRDLAVNKKTTVVVEDDEEVMRFVVNDGLIYTKIDDFRSPVAKNLYMDMKDMEREIRLTGMLLETMRTAYSEAETYSEAEMLKKEIVDNESYLADLKSDLKKKIKEIRQLEIKEYE